MHGYRGQQRGGGGDVEAAGGASAGVDAERKYLRIYEEGINPFKEFQVGCQLWWSAFLLAGGGVWCGGPRLSG